MNTSVRTNNSSRNFSNRLPSNTSNGNLPVPSNTSNRVPASNGLSSNTSNRVPANTSNYVPTQQVTSHNWATSQSWSNYATDTKNSIVNGVTDVTSSNVFLSIMVVVGFVLLAIIGYVFYREYQQTRSYVGEVTGTQFARSDADICKPYIRCMKEEGKKWFQSVDDHKLCETCADQGMCADYFSGECKPGNCTKEQCEAKKPSEKPCAGFLQKSAPHCDIGNVYALQKAQKATDATSSYLPFNLGSSAWWPQNPFQMFQSRIFG